MPLKVDRSAPETTRITHLDEAGSQRAQAARPSKAPAALTAPAAPARHTFSGGAGDSQLELVVQGTEAILSILGEAERALTRAQPSQASTAEEHEVWISKEGDLLALRHDDGILTGECTLAGQRAARQCAFMAP